MTDRSGCGLVEQAVLGALDTVTAGRPRAYMPSAKALARIEERIGLGPRYAYELLLDLARRWIIPVRTVAVMGNYGDRSFPPPGPEYTECRPSHAGQVVLDAEARRLAPVPVGLINGTAYRGGTQPPLDPFRVLAALRRLLEDALVPDGELIGVADPPWSGTNCTVTGDLAALASGRRVVLREAGRITVTGVPVPDEPRRAPSAPGDRRYYPYRGTGEAPPAHLVIESLPAVTVASEMAQAIARRAASRRGPDSDLAPGQLPVASVIDESSGGDVWILLTLRPGTDAASACEQLAMIAGFSAEAPRAFPSPLAALLRSWVDDHRSEDIAGSLTELENAIRRDGRQRIYR